MPRTNPRHQARLRRRKHVRKGVRGSAERPRLSVFRSAAHIYAQVIDDGRMGESAKTLASASTVEPELRDRLAEMKKIEAAKEVGKAVAERCKSKGIDKVAFDRSGFLYHGRVRALADGAREGGLQL